MIWNYKDAASFEVKDGIYVAKILSLDTEVTSSTGKDMWRFAFALKGVKAAVYHNICVDSSVNQSWVARSIAQVGVCFSVPEGSFCPEAAAAGSGIFCKPQSSAD